MYMTVGPRARGLEIVVDHSAAEKIKVALDQSKDEATRDLAFTLRTALQRWPS